MAQIFEFIVNIIGEIIVRLIFEILFDILFFLTGETLLFIITLGKHKFGSQGMREGAPQHNWTSIAIGAAFWGILFVIFICPLIILL